MSLREIVFDTETTGLDPRDGHKIVEIGCIELMDGVQTGRTFHHYLDPERDIPAETTEIHGITNEQVRGKPTFGQIVDDFLAFIGDAPMVAHNAEFDFRFVNAELENIGRTPLSSARMVDTVKIAKRLYPGARLSLDALCSRLGIDTSARVKHGALIDSQILAEVYMEMLGGKQRGLELSANSSATSVSAASVPESKKTYRAPRPFTPTEEELAAHSSFVGKIKNAIWVN
jgi:DNA polymerase III subunit epsilon